MLGQAEAVISRPQVRSIPLRLFLAVLSLTVAGCSKRPDPTQRFASRYKVAMVSWNREVQSVASTFDARIAPIPRSGRRAFLIQELRNAAEMNRRAVASLDALGPPPAPVKDLIAASREMLDFLAESSRKKADATERRDRAAMSQLDAEFDSEMARLGARLVETRNAAARQIGIEELKDVDFFAGATP